MSNFDTNDNYTNLDCHSVDIVLPIYKSNVWVYTAIDSIIGQSYTDWRLIIVDDASDDVMLENIRAKYGDYGGRISYLALSHNHYPAGARMKAILIGSGDYLAFIDQDDIWREDKLKKQIEYLSKYRNFDAVHTNIEFIDRNGSMLLGTAEKENILRKAIPWETDRRDDVMNSLFLHNRIRLVTSLLRRSKFEESQGFDCTLFGGEDWEFWVRFSSKYSIGYLPESLVYRRVHNNNTSSMFALQRTQGLVKAFKKTISGNPDLRGLAPARMYKLIDKSVKRSSGDSGPMRLLVLLKLVISLLSVMPKLTAINGVLYFWGKLVAALFRSRSPRLRS